MIAIIIVGLVLGIVCLALGLPLLAVIKGTKNRQWVYACSIIGTIVTGVALFAGNARLISLYLTDKNLLSDYPIVDLDFVIYTSLIMLILFFADLATLISVIATDE